jgi:hypothetical protein
VFDGALRSSWLLSIQTAKIGTRTCLSRNDINPLLLRRLLGTLVTLPTACTRIRGCATTGDHDLILAGAAPAGVLFSRNLAGNELKGALPDKWSAFSSLKTM